MNNSLYAVSLDEAIIAVGGNGLFQYILVAVLSSASLCSSLWINGLSIALLPAELLCEDDQCSKEELCRLDTLIFREDDFTSFSREWKLACDEAYKRSIIEVLSCLGMTLGGLLFSWTSDYFGRKATLLCCQVLLSLSILLFGLSPTLLLADLAALLSGLSISGINIAAFSLLTEVVSNEHRHWYSALYFSGAGLGTALAYIIASVVSSWRLLSLTIAGVSVCTVPILLWTSESPRYLAAIAGKYDSARCVFKRISTYNSRAEFQEVIEGEKVVGYQEQGSEVLPSSPKAAGNEVSALKLNFVNTSHGMITVTDPLASAARRYTFLYFLTNIHTKKKVALIVLAWVAAALGRFVVTLSFPFEATDRDMVGIAFGVSEVPIYVVSAYFTMRAGRKALIEWLLFFAGVSSWIAEVTYLMEQSLPLAIVLSLTRAGVVSLVLGVFLYTAELCPTSIRCATLGLCVSFSSLTMLIAPFFVTLAIEAGIDALLLSGTLLLASCLAGLDLPDTVGQKLEDYVDETPSQSIESKGKPSSGNSVEKPNFEHFNEAS